MRIFAAMIANVKAAYKFRRRGARNGIRAVIGATLPGMSLGLSPDFTSEGSRPYKITTNRELVR